MYCRMWPRSITLAVKILNQGGKGVQFGGCGVPAHEDFLGVRFEVEGKHLFLVFHINFDLVGGLCVSDCETASNFNFSSIFTSCSQERSNNSVLIGVSAQRVVENRENGLNQVNNCPCKLLAI